MQKLWALKMANNSQQDLKTASKISYFTRQSRTIVT